jgi:hypothetical protein
MKIYIGINTKAINGYKTVDPAGGIDKIALDHRCLDGVAETNECTEILAPTILNHIHASELERTLDHYISKLRHGGKLIIGGTDIRDIAKKIIKDELTYGQANILLYGMAPFNWVNQCGSYCMYDIVELLRTRGLKVVSQKCDDINFIVEAHRE